MQKLNKCIYIVYMDCLQMVFKLFPNWKREAEVKKLGKIN